MLKKNLGMSTEQCILLKHTRDTLWIFINVNLDQHKYV